MTTQHKRVQAESVGAIASQRSVPDWIHDRLATYADLYGLDIWNLYVSLADNPGREGNADGTTDLDTVHYRQAHFTFRRYCAEDGDNLYGRQLVHHEVMHVVLALMHQTVQTIIERMVFEDQKELAADLYEHAQEATIEMIVRSLDNDIEELLTEREKKAAQAKARSKRKKAVKTAPKAS